MAEWNPFRRRQHTGRQRMKQLARQCAQLEKPQPMEVVGTGTDHADREVEIVEVAGTRYARRPDQTPKPYLLVKRDRVNGKIKSVKVATPTAPLRKIIAETLIP